MTRLDETLSRSNANQTTSSHDAPAPKPRGKLLAGLRAQNTTSSSESESDSEDDVVIAPRGKPALASRVQRSEEPSDNEEESSGEGAYERMKKRLMLRQVVEGENRNQRTGNNIPSATTRSSSEDDDDAPVLAKPTRRILSRREKTKSPPASPSLSVRSRRSSPGLFVTPNASPAKKAPQSSGEPTPSEQHNDLEERVQRIRAARLAKQREERSVKNQRNEESDSNSDGENGRRLTQQTKPTRRAGKKALEAMARDQQRIARNMQLAHQAKTKKKFSTKDLFAKLGYNHTTELTPSNDAIVAPEASSVVGSSDAEANNTHDTPPSSPPSQEDTNSKDVTMNGTEAPAATTVKHPENKVTPAPVKLDKGKGRAPEFQHLPVNPLVKQSITTSAPVMIELSDSDDDLEVPRPKSRFPVFDRMPEKKQKEAPAMLHLRHLAHLTSPGKNLPKGKKSTNMAELQFSLAQKARKQAQQERQEKIEELRLRGIHIETEEEREKRQTEIEDLVAQLERAREEDRKLAKMEKEEAKKKGEYMASSDESEDDDYVGSGEDNENLSEGGNEEEEELEELELSGSDEEMEDEDAAVKPNTLVDDQAEQDDDGEVDDGEADDEELPAPARNRPTNRTRNIIMDDEDESGDNTLKQSSPTQQATQDETMAAFGFGKADAGLGLTQMFAGTMADLESASQAVHSFDKEPEQDSLDFLRSLPDTQPGAMFTQASDTLVPNSQTLETQQTSTQDGQDTQWSLGISQLIKTSPAFSRTQFSELPEPTQDAGFELSRSPAGIAPLPSTMDTVMMAVAESPVLKRRGKLLRGRHEEAVELSDADDDLAEVELDSNAEEHVRRPTKATDVFSEMKKAAKKQKAINDFNKKTSWAKDAVDEQAEESEDEYAGLGGASDDDSGEEDVELKQMIDTNDVKVDERQLAAFYADKAKAEDQKNINQLYKDLMNGGLRKRAGRDAFDMSDSEDEAELRKRRKQAEFRKMTKALVSDERVGKIAQNPKQAAFFQTLADHMDDPDYDFLNAPEDEMDVDTSQDQSQENREDDIVAVQDSQADTNAVFNPLKRKSPDSQKENRPPPNLRRTAPNENFTRKPITFADVQHSVSELLEDPHIVVPDSQYSESEDENEAPAPKALGRKPIIDRLSRSNTFSSESTVDAGKMAFHAPSTTATLPGFRIPSLIRRSTSNFSSASERSSGANTPTESGVRRGGTDKSNIHAQAREAERRALLEKKETKRKEALKKKVDVGRKRGMRSVLGHLGGEFE